MVTEITKDIFPDDKKYKKCKKSSLKAFFLQQLVWYGGAKKWSFRVNLSDVEVYKGVLAHPRTKPWIFHTPWMSWGLWKILNFEDCLEKFGCINLHVKKSFFYVLFNFDKMIFWIWPWVKSLGLINPLLYYWSTLPGEKIWIGVKWKMCL